MELSELVEIGRNTGYRLLDSAVSSAKNNKQLQNQLYIAKVAAIHILATDAYNGEIQLGKSLESLLDEYKKSILGEVEFMKSEGQMLFHDPKKRQ